MFYPRILEPAVTMVKSPFLLGITGPGFIGDPRPKAAGITGEEDEEGADEAVDSIMLPPLLPKRSSRADRDKDKDKDKDRTQGVVPPTPATQNQAYTPTQKAQAYPVAVATRGTAAATPTPIGHAGHTPIAGPSRIVQPAQPITPIRTGSYQSTSLPPPAWAGVRSFAGVLGGQHVMDQIAVKELLPPDTG
jgi:hypothetical protein